MVPDDLMAADDLGTGDEVTGNASVEMPLAAQHAGVWQVTYQYGDPVYVAAQ